MKWFNRALSHNREK